MVPPTSAVAHEEVASMSLPASGTFACILPVSPGEGGGVKEEVERDF